MAAMLTPASTLAASIAAIAIGIGACMTIVTVRHVMSDNPVEHKNDRLFHVQLDNWNPNDPYEEPKAPELRIDTTDLSPSEAAQEILLFLGERGYI